VWVSKKNIPEEWTACAEDDFMGIYLVIIHSGQGNISKVLIFPQLSECVGDTGFKVIPGEADLLIRHFLICIIQYNDHQSSFNTQMEN
jgi:hypothetical protein